MKLSSCVFLLICIIFASVTNSHAFRCGNDIVSRWDVAATAQTKCGAPFQTGYAKENIDGNIQYVQKWFFNCGYSDFIYSVSILNGTIIKIDSVSRGTGVGQCK